LFILAVIPKSDLESPFYSKMLTLEMRLLSSISEMIESVLLFVPSNFPQVWALEILYNQGNL